MSCLQAIRHLRSVSLRCVIISIQGLSRWDLSGVTPTHDKEIPKPVQISDLQQQPDVVILRAAEIYLPVCPHTAVHQVKP